MRDIYVELRKLEAATNPSSAAGTRALSARVQMISRDPALYSSTFFNAVFHGLAFPGVIRLPCRYILPMYFICREKTLPLI